MEMMVTPLAETPPAVLACELDVLHHWFGDTPDLLDQAYGRYADDTAFVSLWWRGAVVGFSRFIRPGRHPLKTLDDVSKEPWGVDGAAAVTSAGADLTRTLDLATLGVRRHDGAAPARTGLLLYRAMFLTLQANDVGWLVAIVDSTARRALERYGLHESDIPGTGPREYMGSPACSPVLFDVASTLGSSAGRALDGLVVPPADQLRLGREVAA
jgi:hypothetical protein